MTKKKSQWHKMALLAACISASVVPAAFAAAPVVYELHSTGAVWGYTGTPCNGQVCSGWEMLNNDPEAVQIAAGAGTLYQLDSDSTVWQWNGAVCNGNVCNPWTQIGVGASSIFAAGSHVYFYGCPVDPGLDGGCGIYQFTGQPCSNSITCPGWTELDNDDPTNYYVQDGYILKLTTLLNPFPENEVIEEYLGQPFDWAQLGAAVPLGTSLAAGLDGMYQLAPNGAIFLLEGCLFSPCTWEQVSDNTNTTQITASNILYQLQNNGTVLQYTGAPCNGNFCNGWVELDENPAVSYIVAGPNTVYELHTNGAIWQFTGANCSPCDGWRQLDNNPLTKMVVPGY